MGRIPFPGIRPRDGGPGVTHLLPLALLLLATPDEAPLVGRPAEHFYGAVGERVRVEVSADRTELRAEERLTLTVRVSGAANPAKLQRPDLRQVPEFADRFHIDAAGPDGPEPNSPDGARAYVYELRPKGAAVRAIPPLLYAYYNPRLNYFATTASDDAIPLKVTPRQASEDSALPLAGPEWLFEPAAESEWLAVRPVWPPWPLAVPLLLGPPLLAWLWRRRWRRLHPDADRLARERRSRAARQALAALRRAATADAVAAVALDYLRHRLDLPQAAVTPDEVARHLGTAGQSAEAVAAARDFVRAADAARHGPPGAAAKGLSADLERLIEAVEGAP